MSQDKDALGNEQQNTAEEMEEELNLSGTLFLNFLLLVLIFGFWVMMYREMINR